MSRFWKNVTVPIMRSSVEGAVSEQYTSVFKAQFWISNLTILTFTPLFLFLAPSKIGCTFPRWMQKEKSWATIDGALIWKFATSGNSTWMNMTTVTSNNFGGISSYVKHEESLVWCHKIITGRSLSEALIFATTNPQYDDGLFI